MHRCDAGGAGEARARATVDRVAAGARRRLPVLPGVRVRGLRGDGVGLTVWVF
jgi:hypothetical protein